MLSNNAFDNDSHFALMNLGVERHMGETKTINDPPEFKIDATLKQIHAELSKSDYNVLLAIARENINEKGDFETLLATNGNARPTDLPIRKRYKSGNSRPSSRNSDGTEKSLRRLTSQDVEPDAKRIEFKFKFHGFEVGKAFWLISSWSELSFIVILMHLRKI